MTTPRLGIALGSGSARGWAHVGVLRALESAGIHPHYVCGASAGAFVCAAHVSGNLYALETWGRQLSTRDVVGMMDVTLSSGGVLAGDRVMEFLRERGRDLVIEDLPQPYAAVATDISSGRELWLQSGALVDAVRASMALPGLLTPVCIDGRWLVDGGLVNPVPVSLCRAMGADVVIAVNLNSELLMSPRSQASAGKVKDPRGRDTSSLIWQALSMRLQGLRSARAERLGKQDPKSPTVFEVLSRSLHIMQDRITRSRMAGDPADFHLAPRLSQVRLMDFDRAADAIEAGETCVAESLPLLQDVLGRFGLEGTAVLGTD